VTGARFSWLWDYQKLLDLRFINKLSDKPADKFSMDKGIAPNLNFRKFRLDDKV
jgi:hypothetical protein